MEDRLHDELDITKKKLAESDQNLENAQRRIKQLEKTVDDLESEIHLVVSYNKLHAMTI